METRNIFLRTLLTITVPEIRTTGGTTPVVTHCATRAEFRTSYHVWSGFSQCHYAGSSPAGGPVVPGPPIWNRCPPFHVWSLGCCIHPILYLKIVTHPSGFWPLHLVSGPPAVKSWRRACHYDSWIAKSLSKSDIQRGFPIVLARFA